MPALKSCLVGWGFLCSNIFITCFYHPQLCSCVLGHGRYELIEIPKWLRKMFCRGEEQGGSSSPGRILYVGAAQKTFCVAEPRVHGYQIKRVILCCCTVMTEGQISHFAASSLLKVRKDTLFKKKTKQTTKNHNKLINRWF